jgi:arginase
MESNLQMKSFRIGVIHINGIKHGELIADVCNRLKESVKDALRNREFPLIIGGDHSLAMGSIAANMR